MPTYELRRLPGGVDLGGLYELAASLKDQGLGMTSSHPRVGPLAAHSTPTKVLDVDALLDDPATGIIVCCGSGGVGKTTTSAALALRAAERGRKAVVLTIDPARRLAQAMGIEALDNTPRPVVGVGGAADHGGSLDAMMLDMKRTFDEVVESQATPEKAKQILENPFYIALSSSFAGTQEYMAMEKLGQLHRDAQAAGTYDLIVVDTPPSRSALDFLDAPERLSSFLDGRFVRLLLAPARGPGQAHERRLRHGRPAPCPRSWAGSSSPTSRRSCRRWTPSSAASGPGRSRPTRSCRPTGRRSS